MKKFFLLLLLAASVISFPVANLFAQETNKTINTAVMPEPRTANYALDRTNVVLQRAWNHPGKYDIVFIGDSITQGWEGPGKNVWDKFYGNLKCLNLGVSGDRTQHILWRFDHGQLKGLKPKVSILLIGTNNSRDNSPEQIAEGVKAILDDIRKECPRTKILLLGVFPRHHKGDTAEQIASPDEVNALISKFADGKKIVYLNINDKFLGADGQLHADIMPDFLHPNEHGYEIWAEAMQPTLDKMLK